MVYGKGSSAPILAGRLRTQADRAQITLLRDHGFVAFERKAEPLETLFSGLLTRSIWVAFNPALLPFSSKLPLR